MGTVVRTVQPISVDTIELVIAQDWIDDAFFAECIEPVINGKSLVDEVKRAERRPIAWAGLTPPDSLLAPLHEGFSPGREIGERVMLLGCCCGQPECSEITAEIHIEPESVTWRSFRGTGMPATTYATLGPYRFSRTEYAHALQHPRAADAPVRDLSVLEALARGAPADPNEWLDLAYIEADWPAAGVHLPRLIDGLRARNRAGNPISEADAYLWAREKGWHEQSSGTIVGLVRAANTRDTATHDHN